MVLQMLNTMSWIMDFFFINKSEFFLVQYWLGVAARKVKFLFY